MIKPEKMIALWDVDNDFRIKELIVIDINKQTENTNKLPASAGACDDGWLGGDVLDTPFGLFTNLATAYTFADRATALKSLRQFGKVEGQDWVASLLDRIEAA